MSKILLAIFLLSIAPSINAQFSDFSPGDSHSGDFHSGSDPCQPFHNCVEDQCSRNYNHECLCQCALGSTLVECFPEFDEVCNNVIEEFDVHCQGNNDLTCQQYHQNIDDCGSDCNLGGTHEDPDCESGHAMAGTYDPDRRGPYCTNEENDSNSSSNGGPSSHSDEESKEDDDSTNDDDLPSGGLLSSSSPWVPKTSEVSEADRGKKKCCERETVMCISCIESRTVEEVCNDHSEVMGCSVDNMFPPEFNCPFNQQSNNDDKFPCHQPECSDTINSLNIRDVRPECLRVLKDYCEEKDENNCKELKKRVFFTEPIRPNEKKVIEKANIKLDIPKNTVKEEIEIGITKLEEVEVVAHLDTTRYEDEFKSDLIALTPHGQTFQEPVMLEIPFNYTRDEVGVSGDGGTDKGNTVEYVDITNDEILLKVRIVKAATPDSLIWTELSQDYEVIDAPPLESSGADSLRKLRQVGDELSPEDMDDMDGEGDDWELDSPSDNWDSYKGPNVRKILRVPITSFSVYAVVSSKVDSENTNPISFDDYDTFFDYSSQTSEHPRSSVVTSSFMIAVWVGLACIAVGGGGFLLHQRSKNAREQSHLHFPSNNVQGLMTPVG